MSCCNGSENSCVGLGLSDTTAVVPPVIASTTVENIAALKEIQVLGVEQYYGVNVLGYYTAGDGGGGVFFADRTSVVTDNGGTVIAPDFGGGRWIRAFNSEINAKWFGATGDGQTDDTEPLQNALNSAFQTKNDLYIPGGEYIITETLVLAGRMRVRGSGCDFQNPDFPSTIIKAGATGILMMRYSAQTSISDIGLNGDNKALWGIMSNNFASHTVLQNIEVGNCTEYGFVVNQLQNGSFIQCTARYNKYGWVLANGARNNNFSICSAEVSNAYVGTYADARCILFLIDLSNPHGFGLSTNVVFDGNSCNNFFGGVFERCHTTIQTLNNSSGSYSGVNGLLNWFWGCNPSGDETVINTSGGYLGIEFIDCELATSAASKPMSSGTSGLIRLSGFCNFNGGEDFPDRGFSQNNNYRELFYTKSSDLNGLPSIGSSSSVYQYEGGVAVPIAFSETTRTFSLTGGGAYTFNGLQVLLGGPGRSSSATIGSVTARSRRYAIKATFTISNVVGGTGLISVYEPLISGTFRTLINNYAAGTYSIIFICSSNSAGGISFSYNGATSFDVSNISIEFV